MINLAFDSQPISKNFGFSSVSGLQAPVQRLHRHDEIELGILEHGSVDAVIGGVRCLIPPSRLVVFWAAQPHGPIGVEPGAYALTVHIPLAYVTEAELSPPFLQRLLAGNVIYATEGADSHLPDLLLMKHWVRLLADGSQLGRQVALHEVIARLLRLGAEYTLPPAVVEKSPLLLTDSKRRHFLQIMKLLAERCSEQWTIPNIADEIGLNPSFAMRVFQEVGGITIGTCLTQQRVALAQRLLCTTDLKTLDIAFECGFASVSSFYEMFTRTCGQSPGKYRRMTRQP